MIYKFNLTNNLVTSFETGGETYTLKTSLSPTVLEGLIATQSTVYLTDDTLYCFKAAGGSALTTDKSLLEYILTNNNLTQGTELTNTAVPSTPGAKGFLTGTAQTALLTFYQSFGYNEEAYKLLTSNSKIEISFKGADRRSGVAGSRNGWSEYFKLTDLMKGTPVQIIDALTGTDTTAFYNIQGQITKNANGNLFLTLTDTHSGNNLYGAIVNIRHRAI